VFFFQAEDGIRDFHVTGVQTCALPITRPQTTTQPSHRRPPRPSAPPEAAVPRCAAQHALCAPPAQRTPCENSCRHADPTGSPPPRPGRPPAAERGEPAPAPPSTAGYP